MMVLKGHLWKEGKFWLIELPLLCAITQGHGKKDVFLMAKDLITCMLDEPGEITVTPVAKNQCLIKIENTAAVKKTILQRNRARNALTLEDMRRRLGNKSRNAYAQYEQNKTPTWDQVIRFLETMDPDFQLEMDAVA